MKVRKQISVSWASLRSWLEWHFLRKLGKSISTFVTCPTLDVRKSPHLKETDEMTDVLVMSKNRSHHLLGVRKPMFLSYIPEILCKFYHLGVIHISMAHKPAIRKRHSFFRSTLHVHDLDANLLKNSSARADCLFWFCRESSDSVEGKHHIDCTWSHITAISQILQVLQNLSDQFVCNLGQFRNIFTISTIQGVIQIH